MGRWLLLAAMLWSGLRGQAQVLTPTTLSAALSKPTAEIGQEVDLLVNARIDKNWHLYATDFDPELGPTVFAFTFAKSAAFELVGPPVSVGTKKKHDDVFNGTISYFEGTGLIRQRIRLLRSGTLTIKAEVEYQTCTDVDGRCVPGSETLTFGPLTVSGAAMAATGPAQPAAPAAAAPKARTAAGAAVASGAVAAPAATADGLWSFGLLAFLSGLAALLTPCVFPMVPMTVSYFTGSSGTRRQGIIKALVYGLSIIVIYTLIGVVVARLLGEDGPNFMATHWLPNLVFFVVFVVFGLSFLGLFEITLPHGLVNKMDAQADKGGWLGVFFMAFTLVLVSFSCTGPIVATILGLSARGQTLTPVVGMLGFSLAFALPFTLFAIFPSWLKSLPRSGGWLNTVKVVLGFVELMLALKFLSMADLAYHWNLLPRDLYLVIWVALGIMLMLYLLGKFRLSHDSDLGHLSVGRLLLAVLSLIFVVYLVPGLFGAPLPLLAGYLPPQSSHDFSLVAPAGTGAAPAANAQCEAPRYADMLELPHGLRGYFDLEQAKRCAQAQHKPLFIDFTGHACVNCRKMEATVWSDPQVLQRLRDDYVVVALYVDDKAELPAAQWYTSARDGQLKTTLGKQNADLQVTRYGVNAQPYYVLLDPASTAAAPMVAPVAYQPDAEAFVRFLDAGSQRYRATQSAAAKPVAFGSATRTGQQATQLLP
jgi:thiol:disulfide interchange protein DsbD